MRIGVVTLATADLERASSFYRALLEQSPTVDRSGVVYFRLPGASLALFPRGFGGVTLSVNLASAAAVDAAAARATAAGARMVRAPGPADWGGHIAWISDPDGHLWELVFNPRRPG